MRILVIDDETDVRQVIAMLLRCWGHEVVQATDGVAGLKVFKPGEFDLVTTDDVMPGMGGEEVIQRLREIQPNIPILMITAFPSDMTVREHYADGFVPKPFTVEQLKDSIVAVMGKFEEVAVHSE
jgi:CheY-like chemotaxis protein